MHLKIMMMFKMFSQMPHNMSASSTTILAIDPGYERLGVAILEKTDRGKETLVFSECFTTSSKEEFVERLNKIGSRIQELIQKYSPHILAIENLFFTTNQKTAMRVAEVRGALLYIARSNNMDIHEFTPKEIKVAVTGYGSGTKDDILFMVPKLIEVNVDKKIDDEIDAIAVGLTCFAHNRHNNLSTHMHKK